MKLLLTITLTLFVLNSSYGFAHGDEGESKGSMKEMNHNGMMKMDHGNMKPMMKKCMQGMEMGNMNHENMRDEDRKKMKTKMKSCMKENGMDHDEMKGMDHDESEASAHSHGGDDHGGSHANSAGTPLPPTDFVDSTYHVSLLDTMKIRYTEDLRIDSGNVVKFIVTNKGNLRHEFSISNAEEQLAHVQMMRDMPNMKHDDGTTISLESGEIAEMVWKFDGEDSVVFSCNIPGHSEAGMLTRVALEGSHQQHAH